MSTTPLCDANIESVYNDGDGSFLGEFVPADFARQLETVLWNVMNRNYPPAPGTYNYIASQYVQSELDRIGREI